MAATQAERKALGAKRIVSILRAQTVANWRTLEQKIADAGPNPQRVQPHVLTDARSELLEQGTIVKKSVDRTPWFHLRSTSASDVDEKLRVLLPIHNAFKHGNFTNRMGQMLEIAAYRALITEPSLTVLGAFSDLEEHDDATLYSKEEPPSFISGRKCDGKLDFIVISRDGLRAGMEVKNIREWIYPDREEIMSLLRKCIALDIVPVLIGRRIPYVTFKLLNICGVIVHQTFNQLLPNADAGLASLASRKDLLGYHDIRVGNIPDQRLLNFCGTNLPLLIANARSKFDEYKDLLGEFASGQMTYAVFAARVRRRSSGTNEENDWEKE